MIVPLLAERHVRLHVEPILAFSLSTGTTSRVREGNKRVISGVTEHAVDLTKQGVKLRLAYFPISVVVRLKIQI